MSRGEGDPEATRKFDPGERRDLRGQWTHSGAPGGFSFEGRAGGTGHARAMEALAKVLDGEPGSGETAQDLRMAITSMAGRDMAAAHRHIDGAIFQDQVATEGRHRPELEAVKKSLGGVPRGAVPVSRLPAAPPALGKRPRANLSPGVIGGDASGSPAQFSAYGARRAQQAGGKDPVGAAAALMRKTLAAHGADPATLDAIMPGLEAGARQMLSSGDYSAQGEATRFDPAEKRGYHGRWISAGVGLAGHLHGQHVTGQRRGGGKNVHGTYLGGGLVQTGGGERVPVSAVRPHETLGSLLGAGSAALPEGQAPLGKSGHPRSLKYKPGQPVPQSGGLLPND